MLQQLVLTVLATFFLWESLRFVLETYASRVFTLTRPVHPLFVVALPLYVLWPDWLAALAAAGATGLVVATVDKVFGAPVAPVVIPRPNRGGLPPLP